jgi:antibiotic biosynthesis monooxygenase (ABM) superfamily enzyme
MKMIYVLVSTTATAGKEKEAVAWLKKLATDARERHGWDVEIINRLNGPVRQYGWLRKVESLAVWEASLAKADADPQRQAIFEEGKGLFSDSQRDFWEVV